MSELQQPKFEDTQQTNFEDTQQTNFENSHQPNSHNYVTNNGNVQSDFDAMISLLVDANIQINSMQEEIRTKNDKILQLIDAKLIIEDALINTLNSQEKNNEKHEQSTNELREKITIKNRIIRRQRKQIKQLKQLKQLNHTREITNDWL